MCDWYEHLTEEEQPPRWMWPFEEELEIWFAEVEEKRKAKYGGGDSSEGEEPPMIQNELAKGRGR